MDKKTLLELKKKAVRVRKHILDEVYSAQSGHPGGSLSSTEIFTYLFQKEMKIDPANPKWMDRDRFVLSKGHCAPGLYASLAVRGFFPEKDLTGFRSIDSYLQGHPSMKDVPGVDMSTGSLGQGISTAVGMALGGKLDKKDYRVFALLGDGEIQEGQVWEALMSAAHYKLDNLTAFIDHNGLQIDGNISDVMCPEDVVEKFKAFCWNVIQIDGHDLEAIEAAVETAKATKGKPTMIVAETIKGKGVSYMEGVAGWHGMAPDEELYKKAIAELDEAMALLEVE
jgi:transketolase